MIVVVVQGGPRFSNCGLHIVKPTAPVLTRVVPGLLVSEYGGDSFAGATVPDLNSRPK